MAGTSAEARHSRRTSFEKGVIRCGVWGSLTAKTIPSGLNAAAGCGFDHPGLDRRFLLKDAFLAPKARIASLAVFTGLRPSWAMKQYSTRLHRVRRACPRATQTGNRSRRRACDFPDTPFPRLATMRSVIRA